MKFLFQIQIQALPSVGFSELQVSFLGYPTNRDRM